MADVSGKFYSATKVRTGVSPSSPGVEVGETLPPVNPPGSDLNSVGLTMPAAFVVANSPLTSNGTLEVTGAGTTAQYIRGDGTLASFPSLTGYVPYTGATADVDLGTHDLTAERGTFTNNGSSDTLTVNHTSGSGYGIIVTKGGNGEAFYVSKTSGSGNAMTVIGGRTSLVDLALSSVTNTAGDFLTLSGGVVHKRTAAEVRTDIGAGTGNGTVTSVAALTLGTSGTDLSSTVANGTTTPVITLNVPTASATNRGALSSADWTTFNSKENAITAGTTAQYFRGDKTFQTLNTSVVPELTNLYYTEARVNANTNVAANTAARHNAVTLGTANGLSLSTQVLSLGLASAGVTGALSGTDWSTFNNKQNALTNPVTGTGTTNYLPKFTGSTTIGNSIVFDNGTNVGIGTNVPYSKLDVAGSLSINGRPILDNSSAELYIGGITGVSGRGTDVVALYTNNTERIKVFSDGNTFIGSSSSNAGFKLDVNGTGRFSGNLSTGSGASFTNWSTTGNVDLNDVYLSMSSSGTFGGAISNNAYFNSGWKYKAANNATLYQTTAGEHRFFTAGVGAAAGNAITFINALTLASTGAATFSSTLQTGGDISLMNASGDIHIRMKDSSGNADRVLLRQATTNDVYVGDIDTNNGRVIIRTNGNDSVTISSAGAVQINNISGSGNRIVIANSSNTLISAVIGSGLAFDGTTLTATGGSSGSISGSGTSGTIALFTGSTSIGNSVITQSSGNIIVAGKLNSTVSNNAVSFENTSITTGWNAVLRAVSTGGNFQLGLEGSTAGNRFTNSIAYATFLATYTTTPIQFATDNVNRMTITSGGNVLINTTSDNGNKLRVNGTIFSDSSVTATSFFESSDATLKTLVQDDYQAKGIDCVVAKLYIKNGKQELGYFAQDLENILPSAVNKGSDGLLNLSYREVHTAKIAYLEEEIRQIKKRYEIN
jgi:hypothetical protein